MKHKYICVLLLLYIIIASVAITVRLGFALTLSQAIIEDADDEYVGKTDTNYTIAHDSATGTPITSAMEFGQQYAGAGDYWIRRSFLLFNTTSLSGGTITAAKLCLWGVIDNTATDFIIRLQKWRKSVV